MNKVTGGILALAAVGGLVGGGFIDIASVVTAAVTGVVIGSKQKTAA